MEELSLKQDRPLHKGPYRNWKDRYTIDRGKEPENIGQAIRHARRAANLTQAQLAAKMFSNAAWGTQGGITRTYITQMETGAKPVFLSNWHELCRHLPSLAALKVAQSRDGMRIVTNLASDNSGRPKKSRIR